MQFNYPDFIYINNTFTVLNGPGGRLLCDVESLAKTRHIKFTGDYELENAYYLAYQNYLGNQDNESRPYYDIGNKLDDFNTFPLLADSVTRVRLAFLNTYSAPLDSWFKKHEQRRLAYNGIFRKYNVLLSKEFYGGKKISVTNAYFDFEQEVKLKEPDMVLNTDYLWAINSYFYRQSKQIKAPAADSILYAIDSLAKGLDIADVIKMRYLPMLYMHDKAKYDAVFPDTHFKNPANKLLIDSLIQSKLGLPAIGKTVPTIMLKDINGNLISLKDYTGQNIIINFWAVWCGPCKAEFPVENKLFKQFTGKGIAIINICVDSDRGQWQAVSKRDNLQMINLYCDAATYKSLKNRFNIGALPRSILVSRQQKVVDNYFKRASLLTAKDLDAILKN